MSTTADWLVFRTGARIPSGVAVDAGNRLYVGLRAGAATDARDHGGSEVLVLGPQRRQVGQLRLPQVAQIHAISIRDKTLLVTDRGSHAVLGYDLHGRLQRVLGTPDRPAETGCPHPGGPVATPAGPFNGPTQAVRGGDGRTYVSDGYGNARVHSFDPSGRHRTSRGRYGAGPGEFKLPHSLALTDTGRLLVCDRENSRIQTFDTARPDDRPTEWWRTHRPTDVHLHGNHVYVCDLSARVTRLSPAGKILAQWPVPPSAHNLCVDHDGRIYVTHIKGQSVTMIEAV